MKVVVSTRKSLSYKDFIVVDSLKKCVSLEGTIEVVVINSYIETDFEAGVFFNRLVQRGVTKFYYIAEKMSTTIQMLIIGKKGFVSQDEFYLTDEDELQSLVEDENLGYSISLDSLSVIEEFVHRYSDQDSKPMTPLYLEQVKQAMIDLSEQTHSLEAQVTAMGNTASELFLTASKLIASINKQNKEIAKKLEELENQPSPVGFSFENNIVFFPTYNYLGNKKVIVIREYSPTRYLTSFVLGYANYLQVQNNLRVKVVFIVTRAKGISDKYSEYSMITQENMKLDALYDAPVIATNNPKKEVLKEIFSKPDDVFIVVDRLWGMQDIVSGRVKRLSVANSFRDINRYRLKPEETVFSVVSQEKQLFCLSTIKNYPLEITSRKAVYFQLYHEKYKLLDKLFDIGGIE